MIQVAVVRECLDGLENWAGRLLRLMTCSTFRLPHLVGMEVRLQVRIGILQVQVPTVLVGLPKSRQSNVMCRSSRTGDSHHLVDSLR